MDKRVLDFLLILGGTILWVYLEQVYLKDPMYTLSL